MFGRPSSYRYTDVIGVLALGFAIEAAAQDFKMNGRITAGTMNSSNTTNITTIGFIADRSGSHTLQLGSWNATAADDDFFSATNLECLTADRLLSR